MKVQAIVYTSNTGFTARYAQLLSECTGLPAYTLEQAGAHVPQKARILYMSWLMAGTLVDYKKAARQFELPAVCSVGLNATVEQAEKTRAASGIPASAAFFPLQGGYDGSKLKGMYKIIMKLVVKMLIRQLAAKAEKTPEDETMLCTLRHGGSFVRAENLSDVIAWLNAE